MKHFLKQLFRYVSLFALLYFGLGVILHLVLSREGAFAFDQSKNVVILGNSWTRFAIDDQVFSNSKNFSDPAEHYLQSYAKLKLIMRDNPHIDTLLLGYTSATCGGKIDNFWLFEETNSIDKFSRFYPIFDYEEWSVYVKNDPLIVFNLKIYTLIQSILSKQKYAAFLGRYEPSDRHELHLAAKIQANDMDKAEKAALGDDYQSLYFNKIKQLCAEHNIALLLITPPLHRLDKTIDDRLFESYHKTHFPDTPLLDYRDFPLEDSCFGDYTHLNSEGAAKFSQFLKDNLR